MSDTITIEKFISSILGNSKEAPPGNYFPALVVGLGGSGCRTLRQLKRRLDESATKQIRLLGIDSDNTENTKFTPELPQLNHSELVLLDAPVAIGVLERAAKGHPAEAHVLEYLPQNMHATVRGKIVGNRGAGQFRRAGRLLFCSNVSNGANLGARLVRIKQELVGLDAAGLNMQKGMHLELGVRIFVVGSIAGGTGAGLFIDCLALLRHHFPGENDIITALCVLPGELFDRVLHNPHIEKRQTRANALGVLRELQAFMMPPRGANAFEPAKHVFVFDVNTRSSLGIKPLVNDVYLVDHYTKEGRLASDIGDVFHCVSLFIYSLVGSGVGASKASGSINNKIDMADAVMRNQGEPCIFSAFGVGVAEYPVEDVLNYAARTSLGQHLERWLGINKADKEADKEAELGVDVATFVTSSNLANLTAMREMLTPDGGRPLLDDDWRKVTLKMNDADFFERVTIRRERVRSDFSDRQTSMSDEAENHAKRLSSNLEDVTLRWGATSLSALQAALVSLRKNFKELEKTRQNEAAQRKTRGLELEKNLARRRKLIDIIGLGLDKGLRQKYLDEGEELVKATCHESMDVNLSNLLLTLNRTIDEVEIKVNRLTAKIKSFVAYNKAAIAKIEQTQPQSCFVHSVLARKEYRLWVQTNLETRSKIAPLAGFEQEDLFRAILEPLMPNFTQRLNKMDLQAESKQNEPVENAIKVAIHASQPMIHLIPSAPADAALQWQRYVAGNFLPTNDPFVHRMFADLGGNRLPVSLPNNDSRRIVSVSTISGFAAAHWHGFDVAESYYREQPWNYHILADSVVLPEIRPPDSNDLALKRDFGVALLFDMIVANRNNYYLNLENDPVNEIAVYLLHKEDWGPAAISLLGQQREPKLAQRAPTDRLKPIKHNLLGGSLAKSIEELSKGTRAPFRQLVSEIREEFASRVGNLEMKRLVDDYVEQVLTSQLKIAVDDSDRKKSLEEIRTALRKYAEQLA